MKKRTVLMRRHYYKINLTEIERILNRKIDSSYLSTTLSVRLFYSQRAGIFIFKHRLAFAINS